jgi:hypothetical protein
MPIPSIHAFLARAFTIFALLIALYALFYLIRRQEIGGDFWGAVVIGEGLIVLQALLGLVRWIQGGYPARTIHFLYGALCVFTWPAVFVFTKGRTGRREVLVWLLVSAFLFGLALRAMSTG